MPLHIHSPLIRSAPLSQSAGADVWLKLDAVQPAGSFKIRGIGKLCEHLVQQGMSRLVCSSGGNAGLAVAYAGQALGARVTVVLPSTTPRFMVDRIAGLGAQVKVHGDVWDSADELARELAQAQYTGYVSPFDHPLIWSGHASVIEEIAASIDRPDLVVVAVGGGGLLCGVVEGLSQVGWNDVPVMAVETEGAASLAAACAAGKPVTIDAIKSIAKSLGARRVGDQTFACTQQHEIILRTVTDNEAIDAMARFLDHHRLLVEPACGAALVPMQNPEYLPPNMGSVVVIVCGGAVVTHRQLADWTRAYPLQHSTPS